MSRADQPGLSATDKRSLDNLLDGVCGWIESRARDYEARIESLEAQVAHAERKATGPYAGEDHQDAEITQWRDEGRLPPADMPVGTILVNDPLYLAKTKESWQSSRPWMDQFGERYRNSQLESMSLREESTGEQEAEPERRGEVIDQQDVRVGDVLDLYDASYDVPDSGPGPDLIGVKVAHVGKHVASLEFLDGDYTPYNIPLKSGKTYEEVRLVSRRQLPTERGAIIRVKEVAKDALMEVGAVYALHRWGWTNIKSGVTANSSRLEREAIDWEEMELEAKE